MCEFEMSEVNYVKYGIPQSYLSPLLFLVYLNDL